jgi:hypothetical protein
VNISISDFGGADTVCTLNTHTHTSIHLHVYRRIPRLDTLLVAPLAVGAIALSIAASEHMVLRHVFDLNMLRSVDLATEGCDHPGGMLRADTVPRMGIREAGWR